jgi:catechol 2,3-dioxygenase-like lactoylglutathione lyase family enzyme
LTRACDGDTLPRLWTESDPMKIEVLDHVNIRTPDVQATARFFADVLGMRIEAPMGRPDTSKGAWMYNEENRAVIHIGGYAQPYPDDVAGQTPETTQTGSARVHHIAFRCSGYSACADRLRAMDLPFMANDIPSAGLRQIFVKDPNGINLELNFFNE